MIFRKSLQEFSRGDVEEFLLHEAALLDAWQLPEWRELFMPECRYIVPATNVDSNAAPEKTLLYIADDGFRLTERVKRLMKKTAHAEYPRSRILHLVTNIRVLTRDAHQVTATANFATYRSQRDNTDVYIGHHEYLFATHEGDIRIEEKRSVLHMEALRPHGRITLIV